MRAHSLAVEHRASCVERAVQPLPVRSKRSETMARPLKEIDKRQFESLCAIQCTLDEMCAVFDCCTDTLESWCKRTYDGRNFSDVFREKRGIGRASLRRAQFELAKKNATMGIWLGKQYLGQKDEPQVVVADTVKIDALSASLRELAEGLESDD